MHVKIRFWKFFCVIAVLFIGLGIACHSDHGLEPSPSIRGTIFLKGQRPDIAGEMITVVAPNFPPQKWTDILRTGPLPLSPDYELTNRDTLEWELAVPRGQYDVVAILWREPDEEWSFESISNILGVYNIPNEFRPATVEVPGGVMDVDSIDMKADFGMIRYGSFIKGKITVKGEFRDDTSMLILAAFPMKPETVVDYLYAMGWDISTPTNESAYPLHFVLDIAPGYVKYVALFWKGEGGDPYKFKKIGEYRLNDDPPILPGVWTPEGIWVSEGNTLINKFYNSANGVDSIHTSIDIIADFDRLQ